MAADESGAGRAVGIQKREARILELLLETRLL